VNSCSYMRTEIGTRHTDNQILVVASGNGERSKCSRITTSEFRPYTLVHGGSPSLSRFEVPDAEDFVEGQDAQAFFTVYKDVYGVIHVYFSTDSAHTKIYYNKYTAGVWTYPESIAVVTYPENDGAVAVADIIANSTAIFYNTADATHYKQVMYITNQTTNWKGFSWGVLDVAFSNDGINWVGPYTVNTPGSYSCSSAICVENVGVIWNGSNLLIFGVEGDFTKQLLAGAMTDGSTLTYVYLASPADPRSASEPFPGTPVSSTGIQAYDDVGYTPSYILWNCTFCFSPDYQTVYMTRGYAYASDYPYGPGVVGSDVPCEAGSYCATGITTYPNRAQVYSMYIGVDVTNVFTGTWNLIYDIGYGQGYRCCR